MTTRYECDRCKRQTTDPHELSTVTTESWIGDRSIRHELHYCSFCSTLVNNAITIVNNGTYGGSLDKDDKIGKYVPHREKYDPLMMEREKE